MAHQVHEIIGPRQCRIGVLHPRLHEEHPRRLHLFGRGFQRVEQALHSVVALGLFDEILHHGKERHHRLATIQRQFAAHKVQRLHAVRAFIDLGDAGIAGELRHAPFLDIAMAAIDLLGLHGHLKPLVGLKALDHRGQQGNQAFGGGVIVADRAVDQMRAPEGKGPRTFDKGFLIHQVAADVGVDDQRVGGAGRDFGCP